MKESEGGVRGQSPAATREKASPGGRASKGNLHEEANEKENRKTAMFWNLREENVPKRGE